MKSALFLWLFFALLMLPVKADEQVKEEEKKAPEIRVYMNNVETGSANASPSGLNSFKVRVVYSGCEADAEYCLTLQLKDTANSQLCSFSDGNKTLSQSFTAEGESGFFQFEFQFDAGALSGRTLAEIHSVLGFDGAYPKDVDAGSARIYIPSVSSNAVSESGEKTVPAGKHSVICDVVSYTNLAPGEEYRLVTSLKDALTGKAILGEDGKAVTVGSRFTPTESSGQIASRITANLRKYGNRDIHISEDIYVVPKMGEPVLLISSASESEKNGSVRARLTEIRVCDEMYGNPIADVSLSVSSFDDGCVFEGVSDENGVCGFPLDAGEECSCMVVSVPEQYLPRSGAVDFKSSANAGSTALELTLLQKNIIVITRTDAETDLPVQGIVTEVRDENGKLLSTITTDAEGKARFDANTYWKEAKKAAEKTEDSAFVLTLSFKDCSTPSAYYQNVNSWSNHIDENSNILGLTTLSSYRKYPLEISVVDGRGNGIPAVELLIIAEDGSIQGRAVTDHKGIVYFVPEKIGKYVIVEKTVPSGYVQLLGGYSFTVSENGEVSGSLVIKNLSTDLSKGALPVALLTAAFILVCIVLYYFGKRALRRKIHKSGK